MGFQLNCWTQSIADCPMSFVLTPARLIDVYWRKPITGNNQTISTYHRSDGNSNDVNNTFVHSFIHFLINSD